MVEQSSAVVNGHGDGASCHFGATVPKMVELGHGQDRARRNGMDSSGTGCTNSKPFLSYSPQTCTSKIAGADPRRPIDLVAVVVYLKEIIYITSEVINLTSEKPPECPS